MNNPYLPANHQNAGQDIDPLENLMNKYNISFAGYDEDGQDQFIGNKDDLRNFFIEKENL